VRIAAAGAGRSGDSGRAGPAAGGAVIKSALLPEIRMKFSVFLALPLHRDTFPA
jgi:hypothetical protein